MLDGGWWLRACWLVGSGWWVAHGGCWDGWCWDGGQPGTSLPTAGCRLGPWSRWSSCSASCGGGTAERRREPVPVPGAHGEPCPLLPLLLHRVCNTHNCSTGMVRGWWALPGAGVGARGTGAAATTSSPHRVPRGAAVCALRQRLSPLLCPPAPQHPLPEPTLPARLRLPPRTGTTAPGTQCHQPPRRPSGTPRTCRHPPTWALHSHPGTCCHPEYPIVTHHSGHPLPPTTLGTYCHLGTALSPTTLGTRCHPPSQNAHCHLGNMLPPKGPYYYQGPTATHHPRDPLAGDHPVTSECPPGAAGRGLCPP